MMTTRLLDSKTFFEGGFGKYPHNRKVICGNLIKINIMVIKKSYILFVKKKGLATLEIVTMQGNDSKRYTSQVVEVFKFNNSKKLC